MGKFKSPADHAGCADSYARLTCQKGRKRQEITGPPVHPALINEDVLLKIFELDGMCKHELMKCRLVCRDWARIAGRRMSGFVEKQLMVMPKFSDEVPPMFWASKYLDFLDNRNQDIAMKIRYYRVLDGNRVLRDKFFSHPQVAESIQQLWVTSRNIVGLLPELAKLPNLTWLTIVDPELASELITENEMLKSAPTCKQDFDSLPKLAIKYLTIECDHPQRSNHILKAVLPMAPELQLLDIQEDHYCGRCYCLPVIERFHTFKKLRQLRIEIPRPPFVEKADYGHYIADIAIPPVNFDVSRQNRSQLKRLLKLNSFRHLEFLDLGSFIHLSTFAWRGIFQQCPWLTENLRNLQISVYVSCEIGTECDYQHGPKAMRILESPHNPEPDDFLAFFPKTSDGITMKNLHSVMIKLLYDVRKFCTTANQFFIKKLELNTSRILPSVKNLSLHANAYVDVSNGLSHSFRNLQKLLVGSDNFMWLNRILLDAPQTLKELILVCEYSRNPISLTVMDEYFLTDNCILVPERLEVIRIFNSCVKLTDKVVYQGFLKMKSLKVLELMNNHQFSKAAVKKLNSKFEMIWIKTPEQILQGERDKMKKPTYVFLESTGQFMKI